MTLHKKLDYLPPPNVGTMWVRGPRVRTIRRRTATGVSEFQGGTKFCLQKGSLGLVRKKNSERKSIKKCMFERRLEIPVVRLSHKNKI